MPVKQITVWSQNRPGSLAKIASALAAKGINLSGLFASDVRGKSAVRVLVADAGRARAALRQAGFPVSEERSLVLDVREKPGQLARTAAKLAKARVNISYAYATVSPGAKRARIVLGVGNVARARRALR